MCCFKYLYVICTFLHDSEQCRSRISFHSAAQAGFSTNKRIVPIIVVFPLFGNYANPSQVRKFPIPYLLCFNSAAASGNVDGVHSEASGPYVTRRKIIQPLCDKIENHKHLTLPITSHMNKKYVLLSSYFDCVICVISIHIIFVSCGEYIWLCSSETR